MQELGIIHCTPDFLVVNKPGGLLAVPGRGPEKQDCVVNRVKTLYPDCIAQPAVHRLDMYTSGIMLLARNAEVHRLLSKQFEQRLVEKEYIALLDGIVAEEQGIIELAFRLNPENRPYQIYDPVQGKMGITRWQKTGEASGRTRVQFFPLTGRTHQLRLHAAHPLGLGIPIVGDALYGRGEEGDAMLLHASRLSILHPYSGQRIEFTSRPVF
ncbi:MAG: RluA family pseudouridine synthase [Proteobacteria bacterium]|nr:RluA family pseudouridine synthase [Pseudomonadota bacterium]MBU1232430.1 RluA family pseudouridine synthase [Pseudomonadota bacterium]MBU1417217.1 RluA family pseudouridine synthase [Pseudomonadota bacterium]MBU1453609.1 RluA family pseudouridine synthase [Pseudomonadota bacterium]